MRIMSKGWWTPAGWFCGDAAANCSLHYSPIWDYQNGRQLIFCQRVIDHAAAAVAPGICDGVTGCRSVTSHKVNERPGCNVLVRRRVTKQNPTLSVVVLLHQNTFSAPRQDVASLGLSLRSGGCKGRKKWFTWFQTIQRVLVSCMEASVFVMLFVTHLYINTWLDLTCCQRWTVVLYLRQCLHFSTCSQQLFLLRWSAKR